MSVDHLTTRLEALGLAGVVEARGTLAILTLRDPQALGDPVVRKVAVAAAAEEGFTHLALELDDRDDRAPLPRA
jgi:hypothetical protein